MVSHYDPHEMPGGILCYPKRGEPPPDMEGYRRKSNNPRTADAWIFLPLWQDCSYRQKTFVRRDIGCKCTRVSMVCGDENNAAYQKPLSLKTCDACFALRNVTEHESLVQLSLGEGVSEGVMMVEERNSKVIAKRSNTEAREGNLFSTENGSISDA